MLCVFQTDISLAAYHRREGGQMLLSAKKQSLFLHFWYGSDFFDYPVGTKGFPRICFPSAGRVLFGRRRQAIGM